MYTNILKYTVVICLTLSAMVQMSTIPQVTIIDEMREELSICSFPPAEVLKQSSQGGLVSLCAFTKPLLKDGKPSADDMNFVFVKYLCMELFDLSLQLCSKNVSGEQFPTSEETFAKISLSQNVTNFCEKLQFPSTYAKKTSQFAGIAIDALKNRTFCESQCIKQKHLNPICGAISWASKLLIARSQKQQPVEKHEFQAVDPVVHTNLELETSEMKPEAANTPTMKEETVGKPMNGSIIENKVTSGNVDENGKIESNGEDSKGVVISAAGQTAEKSAPNINPTQLATGTSTVTPVIAEVSNREMDKDGDHEEDPPRIGLGENLGSEDIRLPSDDDLSNVGPKGSNADIFSQEGDADDDVQSRDNSVNGLPYDSKVYHDTFVDAQDSHFFAYFLTMVVICIVGYLLFHNKQKIIALALEGRRTQGSRRRPNTSSYKKLDSNLEEAVTSTCSSSSVNHVAY